MKPQEWESMDGNGIGKMDLSKLGYTGEDYDAVRKTLAPITYDDNGEIIPLSQRFNREIDDVRKSFVGGQKMSRYTDKEICKALKLAEKKLNKSYSVGTIKTVCNREFLKLTKSEWVGETEYVELEKAFGKKDLSKLHKKQITDKNGHNRTVWVKNEDLPKQKRSAKQEETNTSQNEIAEKVAIGNTISFKADNGSEIQGAEVKAKGNLGVTCVKNNVSYHVDWDRVKSVDSLILADKFNANDYKKSFTDSRATNNASGYAFIYESLGETGRDAEAMTVKKLEEQNRRLKKGDTKTKNSDENGNYTKERQELHNKIIKEILSDEKIKKATPKKGDKPKFVMFGGRGGSGKSWFTDKKRADAEGREVMFDSDNFLVLDADALKEYLPEYEGWNAGEVHEESSDLNKMIKAKALELGLNIIIDGTMNYNAKKPDKVKNEMLEAKGKGYTLEAHYMFLPVQESAKRAINRFKTKKGDFSGRLVPMNILMGMQDNEKSFDSVKDIVDDWSFRDNQGTSGPQLISQKEKIVKKSFAKILQKGSTFEFK